MSDKICKSKIGGYQCGFIKGRSTVDAVHLVKQIMENAYEFKVVLQQDLELNS